MGRSLPKYEEYLEKLLKYCEASEIEVEHRDHDNDGSWIPSKRKIALDLDMDDSTEIATLLHELGHSLDDNLKQPVTWKAHDKAYTAFYKNEATEEQKMMVLECERRAWLYGRGVAKTLRIRIGVWYNEEEERALADYGKS